MYADMLSAIHMNMKSNVRKISNLVSNVRTDKQIISPAADSEVSHREKNQLNPIQRHTIDASTQTTDETFTRLAHEIKLLLEISAIDIKTADVEYKQFLKNVDVACNAVLDNIPSYDAFVPTKLLLRTDPEVMSGTHSVEVRQNDLAKPSTSMSPNARVPYCAVGTGIPDSQNTKTDELMVPSAKHEMAMHHGTNSGIAVVSVPTGSKRLFHPCEAKPGHDSTVLDCTNSDSTVTSTANGTEGVLTGNTTETCRVTAGSSASERIMQSRIIRHKSDVCVNNSNDDLNGGTKPILGAAGVGIDHVNTVLKKPVQVSQDGNQIPVATAFRHLKRSLDDARISIHPNRKSDTGTTESGNLCFDEQSNYGQKSSSDQKCKTARSLQNEFDLAADDESTKKQKLDNTTPDTPRVDPNNHEYWSQYVLSYFTEEELALYYSKKDSDVFKPRDKVDSEQFQLDGATSYNHEAPPSIVTSAQCMPTDGNDQNMPHITQTIKQTNNRDYSCGTAVIRGNSGFGLPTRMVPHIEKQSCQITPILHTLDHKNSASTANAGEIMYGTSSMQQSTLPSQPIRNMNISVRSTNHGEGTTSSNIPCKKMATAPDQKMIGINNCLRSLNPEQSGRHIQRKDVVTAQHSTSVNEQIHLQYSEDQIRHTQSSRSLTREVFSGNQYRDTTNSVENLLNQQTDITNNRYVGGSMRGTAEQVSVMQNSESQTIHTRSCPQPVNRRDPRVHHNITNFRSAASLHNEPLRQCTQNQTVPQTVETSSQQFDQWTSFNHDTLGSMGNQNFTSYPHVRNSTDAEIALFNHICDTIPAKRARR